MQKYIIVTLRNSGIRAKPPRLLKRNRSRKPLSVETADISVRLTAPLATQATQAKFLHLSSSPTRQCGPWREGFRGLLFPPPVQRPPCSPTSTSLFPFRRRRCVQTALWLRLQATWERLVGSGWRSSHLSTLPPSSLSRYSWPDAASPDCQTSARTAPPALVSALL